ncbi:hypothetical protein D0860_00878 [Hortaea werneckii]|uniref:Uncharacterized protein n=1 Tax=Hortaea werneckii TaxID=91943 RepID=A0A3M7HU96_HORWE|nr:hypothetical protein D0860_00878 [Hortaea werneckii]
MGEHAEHDHAADDYEDEENLHVISECSPIDYEGEPLENEQDAESVTPRGASSPSSAVSSDTQSPKEAVEQAGNSAQKSARRKRKTSIDQVDRLNSQERLPKIRKALPISAEGLPLLQKHLLTYHEKEMMQIRDYGEDEIAEFEGVRNKFWKCNLARLELDVSICREILGEHEVPFKHQKKPRSPVDCATSISSDTLPPKEIEGAPEQGGSCSHEHPDKTRKDAQDEVALEEDLHEDFKKWKMPSGDYKPVSLDKKLVEALKKSLRTPPRFLYRASSWEGVKQGNGYDIITLHVPAAHMNDDEKCHESLYDIPNGLGELAEMLGHRFLWSDRRRDETLSWTSSLLFAIVHASGRLAKGQRGVVIHTIDTTKVKTLDGRPVEFHFAPDLLRILEIQSYKCWDSFQLTNLRQPWYTHEWITHHVVKSPFRHSHEADIAELIDKGLYSFVSSLKTQEDDDMRSLYHRCCYSRSLEHAKDGSVKTITTEDLNQAKDLAMCFLSPQTRCLGVEPPIHLFIDFLGLKARPKTNPVFIDWIRKRYNSDDLRRSAYENMIRIPNNTPELAQALELARDACIALGMPQIPDTRYCKWLQPVWKRIKIRDRKKKVKLPAQNKELSIATAKSVQDSPEDNNALGKIQEADDKDSVSSPAGEGSSDASQKESCTGFLPGTEGSSLDAELIDGDELSRFLSTDEDGHSTSHDNGDAGFLREI